MIITWTHSWETPNFSGNVPFCYSSTRRRDFMERVSGPLCGDNDQSFRRGGHLPVLSALEVISLCVQDAGRRDTQLWCVGQSVLTTCFPDFTIRCTITKNWRQKSVTRNITTLKVLKAGDIMSAKFLWFFLRTPENEVLLVRLTDHSCIPIRALVPIVGQCTCL